MSDLIITGVIDGPLTGGLPKAIELFVVNDIADLSIYGVSSANNGGGSTGTPEFTLSGSAMAGNFIYVATEGTEFANFFGFAPDFVDGVASINGDDAIELFQNGTVVDVFGEVSVDGTGQPWDYLDGWAYRKAGTGPDGTTFVLANWDFSGINALDGTTTNAGAATPFPTNTFNSGGGTPSVIASEDFDGNAVNLITGFNPATGNLDGGAGDFFGVGSRNAWPQGFPSPGVPFSLGDDSVVSYSGGNVFAGDTEGIFGQNSDFDNDFFAVSDSDEFGTAQTASWTFNVDGFTNLELRIGMGGISDGTQFGGFVPQTATFTVSLDGGATQTAFSLAATTTVGGFTFRPMDSGTATPVGGVLAVTGDNTITKLLAEDGSAAGNTFLDKTPASGAGAGTLDTFSTAINGTGSLLTLTFNTDFPFEAFAFDNIEILGVSAGVTGTVLRILNVTQTEGDAGTTTFSFIVTRSGDTSGATDVDFAVTANTADAADFGGGVLPMGGTLSFAANETFKTIDITVAGDLDQEPNETFTVTLSNATGGATIATAMATGTIQSDDFSLTPIYDIQGAGHLSPLVGNLVSTSGIVTAVDSNGFYLQDPTGDGNNSTSDGIFVFTASAPIVAVGDDVAVTGTVSEFTPGGAATRNLSTTQISGNPTISVNSSGNALPAPVVIGAAGRGLPPSTVIDDDNFGSFDPATDGIDYFESLEGMRVTATNLLAVSGLNGFGEVFGVVDNGVGATGISDRGTLNISPNDFNPERVQIQQDPNVTPFTFPEVNTGDRLGDVTGVLGYDFGNFEILVTDDFTSGIVPGSLTPETTSLTKSDNNLTIASYNVLNLDPNDDPSEGQADQDVANGRFATIAQQIINNLGAPDIIGLQEVQDNSGGTDDGVIAADVTLQTLVNAITAAGGPTYQFIDNTFITNNAGGGQPGANIRTAFLYNADRVSLVDGSVKTAPNQAAFAGSRLPLIADFTFGEQTVTVVNNHFSSKGGSSAILGLDQPFEGRQEDLKNADYLAANPNLATAETFVNGSLNERRRQAQAINDYVDSLLTSDANANVVVLGDLNEFEFVSPLGILKGTQTTNAEGTTLADSGEAAVLTNLIESIPENERYSFNFQGNSQELDHILVSNNLASKAGVDIVNVNTEFVDTDQRASDHDPVLVSLNFGSDDGGDGGDDGGETVGFDLTKSDQDNGVIALLLSNLTLALRINTFNTSFVNELIIFQVDDENGSILDSNNNLLNPQDANFDQADYIQAILSANTTQVVFSSLDSTDDLPNDFFSQLSGLQSNANVSGSSRLGFMLVVDGTLEEVEANPTGETVFISTLGGAQITNLTATNFTLSFGDDSVGGFDDLVVTVEAAAQDDLINEADEFGKVGRTIQVSGEFVEVIDLANLQFDFNNDGTADTVTGQSITVEATLYREAAFNNLVGFYVVAADGSINGLAPTAANRQAYAQAAFNSRVGEVNAPTNESTGTTTFTFEGGELLMPFIISNASSPNADFSNIYFPFLDLNADGADHIRLLSDGVFGFEDLPGGGDQDFDDVIVQVTTVNLV